MGTTVRITSSAPTPSRAASTSETPAATMVRNTTSSPTPAARAGARSAWSGIVSNPRRTRSEASRNHRGPRIASSWAIHPSRKAVARSRLAARSGPARSLFAGWRSVPGAGGEGGVRCSGLLGGGGFGEVSNSVLTTSTALIPSTMACCHRITRAERPPARPSMACFSHSGWAGSSRPLWRRPTRPASSASPPGGGRRWWCTWRDRSKARSSSQTQWPPIPDWTGTCR